MNKAITGLRAIGMGLGIWLTAGRASAETFSIQVGDAISDGVPGVGAGRINVNTETDYYTFTGTAGQSILVEEISAASWLAGWLRWELKSPGNSWTNVGQLTADAIGSITYNYSVEPVEKRFYRFPKL